MAQSSFKEGRDLVTYVRQEALAHLAESSANIFGGTAVIKSVNTERKATGLFDSVIKKHEKIGGNRGLYQALRRGAVVMVPFLSLSMMVILGGFMVLRVLLLVDDAFGLIQLSSRALMPFGLLDGVWAQIQGPLAIFQRVVEA